MTLGEAIIALRQALLRGDKTNSLVFFRRRGRGRDTARDPYVLSHSRGGNSSLLREAFPNDALDRVGQVAAPRQRGNILVTPKSVRVQRTVRSHRDTATEEAHLYPLD